MPVEPTTTIKTFLALWEQRRLFTGTLLRVQRRLSRGKMVIAIFGAGGVGKTTLGIMLSEDFDPTGKPQPYQESLKTENYWLKSNPINSVIVAPGQEQRINHYWPDIYAQLSQAKTAVVIQVVAYGYHSFGEFADLARPTEIEERIAEKRKSGGAKSRSPRNSSDTWKRPLFPRKC